MKSMIFKKEYVDQMVLAYDGLVPEEAHKLMDCIFADDMCEAVQWFLINLSYGCTGYSEANGKRRWSRELVLFIEGMTAVEDFDETIEEQLGEDRREMENLRQIIKERTGIE